MDHSFVSNSYDDVGSIYQEKSDYVNALEYYMKSLEMYETKLGQDSEEYKNACTKITDILDKYEQII